MFITANVLWTTPCWMKPADQWNVKDRFWVSTIDSKLRGQRTSGERLQCRVESADIKIFAAN